MTIIISNQNQIDEVNEKIKCRQLQLCERAKSPYELARMINEDPTLNQLKKLGIELYQSSTVEMVEFDSGEPC